MQIIINEREYVKNIIETRQKPENMSMYKFIKYLIMYYYDQYKDGSATRFQRFILDEIKLFNIDGIFYREFKYANYVLRNCRKMKKGEINHMLRDFDSIDITEQELEIINKAETEKHRKLLFTMYTLAKIAVQPSGWINYKLSEIFKRANINGLNRYDRNLMINDLYSAGLINLNHIVGKEGYKVELHPDSPAAITVYNFTRIGNTYLDKYKDGWKMCECCGKMFKKKSPAQKYCKMCCEDMYRLNNKEQHAEKRRKTS